MFHIVLITIIITLFVVDFKQNFDQKSQHKQCILILCIHSSSSLINLNRYANTQWTIQYNNQPHNYTHLWWFSLPTLSVAQTIPLQPTSNKTLWPSWSKAVDSRTWFLLLINSEVSTIVRCASSNLVGVIIFFLHPIILLVQTFLLASEFSLPFDFEVVYSMI